MTVTRIYRGEDGEETTAALGSPFAFDVTAADGCVLVKNGETLFGSARFSDLGGLTEKQKGKTQNG